MAEEEFDGTTQHGTELDVEESRQKLTAFMALLLTFVGGATSTFLLPGADFSVLQFSVFTSIMLVGLLSYTLRRRNKALARAILLVGPILSFALALRVIPSPAVPFFAGLIVLINAGISPRFGFVAAALASVPLYGSLSRAESLLPALALLWLVAILAWFSSREIYTALRWAWNSQQRIHALLAELRDRRGELNRTLAALTEAARRLERTNKELNIARQQADEARGLKEQFVANVSHELRTPLNLIVGFTEMMYLAPETYEGVLWTPDLAGDLGRMYRASRNLQDLVNDILDLARIDVSQLPMFRELADVRSIVNEAGETILPLVEQRGLAYEAVCPESLPDLFLDRTRIRQVMLNLLNNAIRFTDTGKITVAIRQSGEEVIVSVHDTGLGIPQEQLQGIFEEFRQVMVGPRSRGGAGLGLAISQRFVELHGGRLWVESELGVGSTFHFSLPLPGTTPRAAALQRIPDRKRDDYSRAPLVLVDPSPNVADMLSRHLGDHPILAAKDLDEAEQLIEAQHPLAVVVNNMPDTPLDGWLGTLGEWSQRYSVPILRCSIPSPSWLQRSNGTDCCLTKPVSRESVNAMLQRYCAQPSTILVVDDDPGFVSLMSRMLGTNRLASNVITAYSGPDALRLAREQAPALIFLDLLMPGMGGNDVVQALRSDPLTHNMAIIAVTATSYAEEALLQRSSYLTLTQSKGFSAGALTKILNAAIQTLQPSYTGEESTSRSA